MSTSGLQGLCGQTYTSTYDLRVVRSNGAFREADVQIGESGAFLAAEGRQNAGGRRQLELEIHRFAEPNLGAVASREDHVTPGQGRETDPHRELLVHLREGAQGTRTTGVSNVSPGDGDRVPASSMRG